MNASFGSASAFILTVLANGLWQAALLAGATWLVLRVARGANATTRHAVLVVALAAALVLPVVTTAVAFAYHPRATSVTALPPVASAPLHVKAVSPVAHDAAKSSISASVPSTTPATAAPPWLRLTLPALLVVILATLWALCALALLVRLAFSLLYLERLKSDALPLGVQYRERLERWAAIGKGDRDVRLCRSPEINVPIAVGIFDAMILIPDRLLEELPAEDVDRVLLHELAHLRRADDWFNALERVTEALLFFNPAVRWIVRQLDVEREVACDDWVLERRSEALPYAQCLVNLVQGAAWPHRPMVAPGVFVTRRSISIRIERLLAKQRDVRRRIALGPLAAVAGIAAATCLAGAYVAPSIAAGVAPSSARPATVASKSVAHTQHATPQKPIIVARAVPKPAAEPTAVPTVGASPEPTTAPSVAPSATAVKSTQTHVAFRKFTELKTFTSPRTATPAPEVVAQATEPAITAPAPVPTPTARMIADSDFIAEMAAAGYPNLTVEQLVQLKNMGVTPGYIRDVEGLGFGHPSVEQLVRLRALGVTAEYTRDIRKVFPSATLDEIVEMRAVGVTPAYVSDLKAAGVTNLTVDSVRSMRAVGVSSKYVGDLRAAGVSPLTAESLHGMAAVGVDPAFVRDMAAAGYPHLSPDALTKLRAVGVNSQFLKTVQSHGFHNLTLDQLIELKVSGVL